MITPGELLQGGDEDFVINLYLAVLGRGPDEAGLQHPLPLIAGEPQWRMDLVRLMRNSEEARLRGTPPAPNLSSAVSLDDVNDLVEGVGAAVAWPRMKHGSPMRRAPRMIH